MQKAKNRKQRAYCCRPHAVAGGPFRKLCSIDCRARASKLHGQIVGFLRRHPGRLIGWISTGLPILWLCTRRLALRGNDRHAASSPFLLP